MSSLKELVSRVRSRMNEGKEMNASPNGVTSEPVDTLFPAVERRVQVYQDEIGRLQKKAKNLTNHDTVLRVSRNLLELNETSDTIRSKIESIKKLVQMFVRLKKETEQLIQRDLDSVSTESSEHQSINLRSQSDSSSEDELPGQRNDPMVSPLKEISSVQGLVASTPKDTVRTQNSVQSEAKRPPFGARESRIGSNVSEISASQAAKSLETLLIPSTCRDGKVLTSAMASNDHQVGASSVNEPSRTEPSRTSLIQVTYDHPSKKDIQCPYCSVSFMSRGTLVIHIESKHISYYRMYEQMNQLYSSKNTFLPPSSGNSGLMTESGAKRTKECTVCGQSFSRDKLIDHCRTEHIFEVNNFIWIKNFSDASNSWREFFMRIQGMKIEVEKEKSAAARKSNLKIPSEPVPKEPYDRLRIKSDLIGVKRTALPFNDGEIEATLTKRPRGKAPSRLIESDAMESRPKENQPRNPAKTPKQSKDGASELRSLMKTVSKNRELKALNKSKGKGTVSKSISTKKTINFCDFEVILTEVETFDLDTEVEPEEYFPPIVRKAGPKSKKAPQQEYVKCNKCEKSYLEPLDLALHRLRFCKFRRPNLFRLTSAPSFGDSQDGDGGTSSRTSQDDPGPSNRNGGSSKELNLDPNSDSDEEEMDEDQVMVPDAEKMASSGRKVASNGRDGFASPDSTSEVLVQSREEDGSNPESINSDESEVSDYESDLEESITEEEYEKLVGDCINKEVSIVVDLIDEDKIDMSMVAPRTRSILDGNDLVHYENIRDSPIRDPQIRDSPIRDPQIRDSPIRDPRIRDPRLLRSVVDAASIPVGSEVTL